MSQPWFGQYEVLGEIGRGAMGIVFRALDPAIERFVAIKVIHTPAFSTNEENANLRVRLVREAKAAGKLSHPGIVTIYHLGEQQDGLYIVMELVEGRSLEQSLAMGMLWDDASRIHMLRQIADALDYAHRMGIVHRDIKPANVLIGADGRVKLTDFGIAKIGSQTITQMGVTLGTPAYMSPEQIRGEPLDGRSDQFSLAVIAYQLLTGRKPFEAPTDHAVMLKIATEEPPLAHRVKQTLPGLCSNVLLRALSKHAAYRFNTCTEFIDSLAGSLTGAGHLPAAMATIPPPPRKPSRVKPVLIVAAALALIALTVFAARQLFVKPSTPVSDAPVVIPPSRTPPSIKPSETPQPPDIAGLWRETKQWEGRFTNGDHGRYSATSTRSLQVVRLPDGGFQGQWRETRTVKNLDEAGGFAREIEATFRMHYEGKELKGLSESARMRDDNKPWEDFGIVPITASLTSAGRLKFDIVWQRDKTGGDIMGSHDELRKE